MALIRICVIAVLAACLVASQTTTPRLAGCPALSGDGALFTNTSSTCTAATACETTYTSCLGSTLNCTKATECVNDRIQCLFRAAADTTNCKQLNNVQNAILLVSSGSTRFNLTKSFTSCLASACYWLNATYNGAGTNCSLDYIDLCVSPVFAVTSILFRGNFTAILNDPVKRAAFTDAILNDFALALKILRRYLRMRKLYVAGSRRQAQQTLVAEVEVQGVSASNADFSSAVAAVKANPSGFFASTSAAYSSLQPGQTLTVAGVAVGTASAAFSAGQLSPVTTAAPTTTTANTTTTTSSAPTTATTRAPTPATTTTSGSSFRSVVVAAVLAIAGALMF